MINWKVRIKNKNFWITLVPALVLLAQGICALFGINWDLGDIGNRIMAVIDPIFMVLTILGIVTDPTTVGIGDSERALTYTVPNNDNYYADIPEPEDGELEDLVEKLEG